MKRRDFVKGLAAATAATAALGQQAPKAQNPAPSTTTQGEMAIAPNTASSPTAAERLRQEASFRSPNLPVTLPDVVATTDARYFTATRYAAFAHLCEILMPGGDGYPSAQQVDTPQFLDFHVGGSPTERQTMYNDGLDRLNTDSMKKFSVAFAKTDAKQADAIIRPYLKTWINDHPPREKQERFIALAHRDIRTVTMNSPAWATAAEASGDRTPSIGLYWVPIDPGIETWVSHGTPKASAPLTKQAHP